MKRFLLSILFFVGVVFVGFGQTTFTATQNGNWNVGTTWDQTSCTSGCVAGVDFPGPNDDVLTNDFVVTVNGAFSCRNIGISTGTLNQLRILFPVHNLTVRGLLYCTDFLPDKSLITGNGRLIMTGQDNSLNSGLGLNSETVIGYWGDSAPIPNIDFNFGQGNSRRIEQIYNTSFEFTNLVVTNNFKVLSGTLATDVSGMTGIAISNSTNGNLEISSNATLNLNVPITRDGNATSRVVNGTISGALRIISSTAFANFRDVNISNTGSIEVGFSGADQTQGWWYQSNKPDLLNINSSSIINFNSGANQNIESQIYGNLQLSSGGNKTFVGTGALNIQGDLNISASVTVLSNNPNPVTLQGNVSNNGNWTTSQIVEFTGTNSQTVGGNNPITFGEDLLINKSSGSVTLNRAQTINANLQIDQGTFRPLARTVTLSGNIINDGTIEATQNSVDGGFIFDGTTEISGTGTTQFRNATINNGATLSLATGNEIDLTTNFTNNGTFTHNEGLVRFTQSGTKSISGSSTTTFFDLAVEGGIVNVNGTVDLENAMTFAGSPTIDFDGGGSGVFTVKSTQTRDAAIGNIGTATLQGDVTVERAIYNLRNDGQGYHLMGFPLTGVTVADVQNEIGITGSFTGASTGFSGDGYASVFYYDESLGGGIDNRYVTFPTSSNTEAFEHGLGYYVFTYTGEAPTTVDGRGTIFSGNFDTPITLTAGPTAADGGWNLIANPYPAATDWGAWTKPTVEGGAAHIFNVSSQSFEVITTGNIPQGQAFYVRATADGTLSATESSKVTGTTPTFYRQSPEEKFKIGLDNGSYEDITYVGFKENATDAYEGEYDASRYLNYNETISTLSSDNKKLKINQLAKTIENSCQRSIFISLEGMKTNVDYALNFHDLDLIGQYNFTLKDHFLDQTINLNSLSSYDFNVTTNAASKGSTRFEIIFENKTPKAIAVQTEDVCPTENAFINVQQSDNWADYLVYQGAEVVATAEGTGSEINIEILNEFLVESTNDFEIKAFAAGCDTVSVGNASVQVSESLTINNTVEGSTICRAETQAFFSVATQINASYFVLNGADTIQSFDGNGNLYEGFINSSELEDGLNEFTIATNKDGCQSGTLAQALQIEVQNPSIDETITFSANNTCLKSDTDLTFTGQAGVVYKIFKGTTLLQSVTADGTEQTFGISKSNLNLGTNEFTVIAELGECGRFEFPEPIQIEVEENINTNLSLVTENSCGDANTSIVIENAQAGKSYTLQSGGENISSLTADVDGELVFNLNSNQLSQGLNELDIQIEGELCGAVLSSNKAVFTVYEPVNSNLEFVSADVCNAAEASIGIGNAQAGKTYKLFNGQTLVESKTATTAGELIFSSAKNELAVGTNTFNIQIESDGCGLVEVEESLTINLFENINPNLDIISPNVCTGDQVIIEITNPQLGKTYKLKDSENILATEIATDENILSFSLSSDQFENGNQVLTIDIIDDNCGTITANQTVEFELFDNAVIAEVGNQNVCKDGNLVIDLSSNVAMSSYQLYVGEELISEVSNSTLNLAPTETTTYTLTGIPEKGCSVNTINFTVEVTDLATPGILVADNVLESSVEGESYQWYLNGEILVEETGKIIVAQETGDYSVEVSKANCTKISDNYTFNEEVLNANKALANAVHLYPNPVKDVLNVDMNSTKDIEVSIFTLSGKFMDKMNLNSDKEHSIDMSKFSKGTYLIQLKSGKGTITKRIIKQ